MKKKPVIHWAHIHISNLLIAMDPATNNNFNVPLAIIVAGVLVAGAIMYVGFGGSPAQERNTAAVENVAPSAELTISADDHILGNPDAPVILVEFSDLECPFCKTFHQTMKQVMEEYGGDGKVAWIYRHFPIDSIHPKARKEAAAAECAAAVGGAVKFWEYTDKIFEITPSNNGLDLALLPKTAVDIGLDQKAFEACLADNTYNDLFEKSIAEGVAAGANGTPFTILITKNGSATPINGAQPFETVKALIDKALAN